MIDQALTVIYLALNWQSHTWFVLFVLVTTLDAALTVYAIKRGASEANPAIAWKRCANTLPTPNSSQLGKTFMKITDDANGDPTTIDYYVCKLAGGVYSWVAV
jgi:hypothetical protein